MVLRRRTATDLTRRNEQRRKLQVELRRRHCGVLHRTIRRYCRYCTSCTSMARQPDGLEVSTTGMPSVPWLAWDPFNPVLTPKPRGRAGRVIVRPLQEIALPVLLAGARHGERNLEASPVSLGASKLVVFLVYSGPDGSEMRGTALDAAPEPRLPSTQPRCVASRLPPIVVRVALCPLPAKRMGAHVLQDTGH